jgi:aryl-alcohol dehydrogenase-like predicted oxidoreductase
MNMGTPQWKPWIFDEQRSEPIVRHALEAGVNFIDLADFYSAGVGEEVVGRILGRLARREEIVVTTKVGYDMGAYQNAGGHSRKHVLDGIDASLRGWAWTTSTSTCCITSIPPRPWRKPWAR